MLLWHAVKEFAVDPLDQVGVLPSSHAASAIGGNALGILGGSQSSGTCDTSVLFDTLVKRCQ